MRTITSVTEPYGDGVYRSYRKSTTESRATPGPSKQHQSQNDKKGLCETCGRTGHVREYCNYFMNPMCNNTQFKWKESLIGAAWKREGYDKFTIGVLLQNYPMAANIRGTMPVNFSYATEEDYIGQDLPDVPGVTTDSWKWTEVCLRP